MVTAAHMCASSVAATTSRLVSGKQISLMLLRLIYGVQTMFSKKSLNPVELNLFSMPAKFANRFVFEQPLWQAGVTRVAGV